MTEPLSTDEYRTLLATAPGSAFDADTVSPDVTRLFTPSSHRRALDPDVTVVRGARGSGKTVWTKVLGDDRMREIAAASYMMPRLDRMTVATGHAKGGEPNLHHPSKSVISKLVDDDVKPQHLWSAVVLAGLRAPEILRIEGWDKRVRWVADHMESYERALWTMDQEARKSGRTRLLIFDALEHLHNDRQVVDRLVSGLFEVALDLRMSTSAIRAKIFVRPDMYESAPKHFPDASKLGANATDLTWTTENLYGLLFHQLGNHPSPEAEKFRTSTGSWRREGEGRFIAPVDVIATPKRQQDLFVTMAGPYMGPSHRRGYTYTWLPNHLQDGRGQVSPRTLLQAVSTAATISRDRHPMHEHALHYDAIRESVSTASQIRVDEITEDIRWAAVAVEQLRGGQVPMQPSVVLAYWRDASLSAQLREVLANGSQGSGPEDVDNHRELIDELERLGVMTRRAAGATDLRDYAVDIPDVYRLAFGIGRKGGVSKRSQ
ncbi:hypothetical protein ABZZ74_44930 [Streptomyces sp. NPDC006476]|uniref:hypothetical protein n=1 Tax=Streptomyces sp. NPDC006476 TaxID=3157175 RepID=UPI0033BB52D4